MNKLLLTIGLACALNASVNAQTNNVDTNNPVTLPPEASKIIDFVGSSSNLMVAAYGIAATDFKTFGGGIALAYKLSDMIVPTIRLDYYDRELWMPSASLQLQTPIKLFNKVTMIPFAFAGVAEALGGSSSGVSSGSVVGIFGVGGAIQLSSKWDFVMDYEKWTGFDKDQIRSGFLYKF